MEDAAGSNRGVQRNHMPPGQMFSSTLPAGAAELIGISEFARHHHGAPQARDADAGATRLSALNPSLLQDLLRFDRGEGTGTGIDLLEVLAAARRHGRALLLHLQLDGRVLPLTVIPTRQQALGPLPLARLLDLRLPDLRVLRVEPAREPAHAEAAAVHLLPLGVLLWELALRGAREELLPEIAGVAAYRVAPGTDLASLHLAGTMAAAVAALRRTATPLRDIAAREGFDRARAMRMLNGLYLQAGLMITRTHPAAIGGS